MSGTLPHDPAPAIDSAGPDAPEAKSRRSRGISLIWLIPAIAAAIAGYLAWYTLSSRGPEVTVRWRTGDGLVAGQTRVRHKAVELGTVETVRLTADMTQVEAKIRMSRDATPFLTDRARFWVVRPRFSGGTISGIETLVSGAYIEMDPGGGRGESRREFAGLERPPAVRSDEPGATFTLRAGRLGGIGYGSPVFWRDVAVGEVLDYDLKGERGDGQGAIPVQVFIRAPYDGYVRKGTRFWNSSGVNIALGADGIKVELASIQAVLSGAVAFGTARDDRDTPVAGPGDTFRLFATRADADNSGYRDNLEYVTYLQGSVRGLAVGAPVEFFGIQVGQVRDIKLQIDQSTGEARVRVAFEVQPERIVPQAEIADKAGSVEVARRLVARGMRAQVKSASLITGQMLLALDFVPSAPTAELAFEGDQVVIPSQSGGLDNILTVVSDLASKLERLPIDTIAANLNDTLRAARDTIASPELRQAIRSLSGLAGTAEGVVKKLDAGVSPVFKRLPELQEALSALVARANRTLAGIDGAYGGNSQFSRELERAMGQVGDTARSIRLLADFLDRHPEALVRGRAGISATR